MLNGRVKQLIITLIFLGDVMNGVNSQFEWWNIKISWEGFDSKSFQKEINFDTLSLSLTHTHARARKRWDGVSSINCCHPQISWQQIEYSSCCGRGEWKSCGTLSRVSIKDEGVRSWDKSRIYTRARSMAASVLGLVPIRETVLLQPNSRGYKFDLFGDLSSSSNQMVNPLSHCTEWSFTFGSRSTF